MGDYAVTPEAVSKMKATASGLTETSVKIHQETVKLESVFQDNESGLGAHSSEIQALIEEVKTTEENASKPVKKLAAKMESAAKIRQEHIDSSNY